MDLYGIFNAGDKYCLQPDWVACIKRVNKTISQLASKDNYRCFDISPNLFGGDSNPQSEKEALDAFITEITAKENQNRNDDFTHYSNKAGHFYYREPLKVLALIPGTTNLLGSRSCTYVITEGENQWYITAL